MSQNRKDESPERISEDSDDKNVKKENVKQENVKKENNFKRKLREISPPRFRKTVHKVMAKCYKSPFYEMNDITKRILKKLKLNHTPHSMAKVNCYMDKWISANVVDSDSDEDSSDDSNEESKDTRKERKKISTKTTEKDKEKPSNNKILLNSESAIVDESPDDEKVQSKKVDKNRVINTKITVVKEVIPVIDLTLDLKKEIKNENITIIDEDIASNKIINTPVNNRVSNQSIQPVPPFPVVPGYNPHVPIYYPHQEMYQSYYPNYDPNMYFMPYGYQYHPFNPYYYRPSDYLPNYPIVDETVNTNSTMTTNESNPVNSNIFGPKDIDAGSNQIVEASDRQ